MRFITTIIDKYFPMINAYKSNKKVLEKLKNINSENDLDYMKGGTNLSYAKLQEYDQNIKKIRIGLEEKIKTTLISITLITTMMTILFSVVGKLFAELSPTIIIITMVLFIPAIAFNTFT